MKNKIDIKYDKIKFGLYPQSLLRDDSIIKELNYIVGEFSKEKWKPFEYYNNNVRSDYMYYFDIIHKNIKYRGVYLLEYRPYNLSQDHDDAGWVNTYKLKVIYWFIYEPIEWLVLEEKDDFIVLLTEKSLDSTHYFGPYEDGDDEIEIEHNGGIGYLSNYQLSSIRYWLNEYFMNLAFNETERNTISSTKINNKLDNDAKEYECKDILDKVYLLSKEEVIKYFPVERKMRIYPTDYNEINSSCLPKFYHRYWLRTPYDKWQACIADIGYVEDDEMVYITKFYVDYAHIGVRPVIRINKNNVNYKLPEIIEYTSNKK